MEEIRCRICDSALCVASSHAAQANMGMLMGSAEVRIETDGTSHYFICPCCSAKNITLVTIARNGRPVMQVVWAVMNGE